MDVHNMYVDYKCIYGKQTPTCLPYISYVHLDRTCDGKTTIINAFIY